MEEFLAVLREMDWTTLPVGSDGPLNSFVVDIALPEAMNLLVQHTEHIGQAEVWPLRSFAGGGRKEGIKKKLGILPFICVACFRSRRQPHFCRTFAAGKRPKFTFNYYY